MSVLSRLGYEIKIQPDHWSRLAREARIRRLLTRVLVLLLATVVAFCWFVILYGPVADWLRP